MKISITILCLVLVLSQFGYLFFIGLDGNLDETKLPGWMTPEASGVGEISDLSETKDVSRDKAVDVDDDTQDLSVMADGPITADHIEGLGRATAVRILDTNDQMVGSGVIVAKRDDSFDVVTAYHVIEDLDQLAIESFPTSASADTGLGRISSAISILRSDPALDLAYLRVTSPIGPSECVAVARAMFDGSEMDEAWIVDCTGPGAAVVTKVSGVTNKTARRDEEAVDMAYWCLDRGASPGMSGSALLDRQGHLIGVASGNSKGSAYYCGVEALREFVDDSGVAQESIENASL